jgi:uncharacterized protein (TIGR03067 family)
VAVSVQPAAFSLGSTSALKAARPRGAGGEVVCPGDLEPIPVSSTVFAVALSLMVAPAAAPEPNPPAGDGERLVGVWNLTAASTAGLEVSGEKLGESKWAFTGRQYLAANSTGSVVGTYTIDPTASPKRMDFVAAAGPDKGKVQAMIYELDGDTLRIAYTAGGERPASFPTKPAEKEYVVVLKRVKP